MYEVTYIGPWIPARYAGIVVTTLSLIPAVPLYINEVRRFSADELVESLGYLVFPPVLGLIAFAAVGVSVLIYNKVTVDLGGLKLDLEFIEEQE